MPRNLQIRKLSDKVWKHIDSITGAYILTKFYAKEDDSKFLIVEVYGSRRYEYAIEDISVYNIGGGAETFTNFDDLFLRLEVLKYPGFYVDGEFVFNPNAYDLSEFQNTETDRFAKLSDITGGGVPEAPIDGDLYGRKDGDWEIIPTSGGDTDELITNTNVTGSYDLDYTNETWLLTLTGTTTLTESNLPASGNTKVISIDITGNFSLTYPSGWTTKIKGTYNGLVRNLIVVEYIGVSNYWVTILQP